MWVEITIKSSQICHNADKTHNLCLSGLGAFNRELTFRRRLSSVGRPLVNSLLTLRMLLERTSINTDLTSRLLFAFICFPDLGSSSSSGSSGAPCSVETTLSLLTQTQKRAPGIKNTHSRALVLSYKTFFNIHTCETRRLRRTLVKILMR